MLWACFDDISYKFPTDFQLQATLIFAPFIALFSLNLNVWIYRRLLSSINLTRYIVGLI